MTIGTWDPSENKAPTRQVDATLIARFLQLASPTTEALQAADLAAENWVMSLVRESWSAADALSDADLATLIRLFTRLESLPGWEAGKQSPVIYLVRILKDRGAFDAELRRWIKSNTDNRYLPYGSAL